MQKIELVLDDIQQAQLHAFAGVNNLSIEEAAAVIISQKLSDTARKALDNMLAEKAQSTSRRVQ